MATEKRERQRANRQLKDQYQRQEQRRQTTTRRLVIGGVAVVGGLLVVLALAWIGGAFSDDEETADTVVPTSASQDSIPATTAATEIGPFEYGSGACPPETVGEPVRTFEDAPQLCIDPAAAHTATIATSLGDIVVDLDTASTPGTVNNFVTLSRFGYYDDTRIFRADPSIEIVQGGGLDNSATPGYTIPDEANGFTYSEGQIVMARTPQPNSAGGQWFIVTGPAASNLDADGTYVVFGTVTEGLEIAQEMVAGAGGADGQTPPEEVVVETITIAEDTATDGSTPDTATASTTSASTEPATSGPATTGPETTAAAPTTTAG